MSIQVYAAALLGAAIRKIFPHVQYLGSGVDSLGFYAEFFEKEPFSENFLPMLEKAMKGDIQIREMLGSNALELFEHHGEKFLAGEAKKEKGTVFVAQIGDFYDLCKRESSVCPDFGLLGFEQKKGQIRVFGRAFFSKPRKKEFLKKWAKYPKKNHEVLAKKLDLYEGEFWHARGVILKETLINYAYKSLPSRVEFPEGMQKEYFEKTGVKNFTRGLNGYSFDGAIKDLLQFIEKWIKIFDFETKWVKYPSRRKKENMHIQKIECEIGDELSDKPRLELQIADGLGIFRSGPYIEVDDNCFKYSLIEDIRQFIALLLESTKGQLPFWLEPEQVRVLALEGMSTEPVIEILNRLQLRFTVDKEKIPLKEKMHLALHAKVPYVIVFGKQEEKNCQVTLRAHGSKRNETLTYEQFECLVRREFES